MIHEIHKLIYAISVYILTFFHTMSHHCGLLRRALAILRPAVGVPVFDGVGANILLNKNKILTLS